MTRAPQGPLLLPSLLAVAAWRTPRVREGEASGLELRVRGQRDGRAGIIRRCETAGTPAVRARRGAEGPGRRRQRRRAERGGPRGRRVGSGGSHGGCGSFAEQGPAQGAAPAAPPSTSAKRLPGAALAPALLASYLPAPGTVFLGGRGIPFLSKVPSLARETFYVPVREKQLVAVAEVQGVFGFSPTSLLLHLPPPPQKSPLPFCSELRFICVWRKGGDLQRGCPVFARGTVQKGNLGSEK